MCCGCWVEESEPKLDTPAVRSVLPLIGAVYALACTGGNLHIVIDDNNIEDSSLDWCQGAIDRRGLPDPDWLKRIGDTSQHEESSPEQLAAEQACLTAFKALTPEERASALGLWDGCWSLQS